MAIVPKATQRVAPTGGSVSFVEARGASAAAFGALTGQALESLGTGFQALGEGVGKYVEDVNKDNIRRDAKNAFNQYNSFKTEQMYGTADKPGLLSMQGEDALKAFPAVQKSLEDKRNELLGGMDNKHTQEAFTDATAVTDDTDMGRMLSHVYQQREVANTVASKETIDGAVGRAALAWNSPQTVQNSADIVTMETLQQAQRKGLSPEATQALVSKANSTLYENVIKSASQFDNKQARALYDQYETQMDGVTRAVVKQSLDAKYKQNVADMENQTRFHAYQVDQQQKANFQAMFGLAANETLTRDQINDAASKSKIDPQQAENLITFMTADKKREGGSGYEFNVLTAGIYTDQVGMMDIMQNTKIDAVQRQTLLGIWNTREQNGGIHKRSDVKATADFIEGMEAGPKGPSGLMDPNDQQRVSMALNEFYNKVAAEPTQNLDSKRLLEIRNGILETYHAPSSLIDTKLLGLPPSRFVTKPATTRPKEAWIKEINIGSAALQAALDRGEITQDQFVEENTRINAYQAQVDRMK